MQDILVQIGQLSGFVTAAGGAIILIFGVSFLEKFRKWFMGVWNALFHPLTFTSRKLSRLETKHEELATKLDFIVSQLSPNGGSSLLDAITRVEKHQRISETKMAQYLDTKNAAIFETNAEGLYTWVSKSYEDLVGRPKNDLVNWGWTLAIVTHELDSVRNEWALAVEQKRIFEATYKIDKAGKIISCKCRAVPTLFRDEVVAWTGILMEENGN